MNVHETRHFYLRNMVDALVLATKRACQRQQRAQQPETKHGRKDWIVVLPNLIHADDVMHH